MASPKTQMKVGKVIRVTRKTFDVAVDGKVIPCVVRGKLIGQAADSGTVRVGDDVKVEFIGPDEGVIHEILPRRSRLSRVVESRAHQEHIIATNID
ncbi:MAG: hypothetical protein D6813_10710, partial [Calditrichaeota bacterium]